MMTVYKKLDEKLAKGYFGKFNFIASHMAMHFMHNFI
jgi:hypothetical protein